MGIMLVTQLKHFLEVSVEVNSVHLNLRKMILLMIPSLLTPQIEIKELRLLSFNQNKILLIISIIITVK